MFLNTIKNCLKSRTDLLLVVLCIPFCVSIWFDFAIQNISLGALVVAIIYSNWHSKGSGDSIVKRFYRVLPILFTFSAFIAIDLFVNQMAINWNEYRNFWQFFIVLILAIQPLKGSLRNHLDYLIGLNFLSVVLYSLWVLCAVILLENQTNQSFRFLYNQITYFEIHITYLGLWFLVASYTLHVYLAKKYRLSSLVLLPSLLFLFLFEIRVVFFVGIVVFLTLLLRQKRVLKFALPILLISIISFFYFAGDRFKLNQIQFNVPTPENLKSADLRFGVYSCGLEFVMKHPLMGVGQSRVQQNLDACYLENYTTNLYQRRKFDSHNLYLHFLLAGGILGSLLLLWPLYNYAKAINPLDALNFVIIFGGLALSENYIFRQHGILILVMWFIFLQKQSSD